MRRSRTWRYAGRALGSPVVTQSAYKAGTPGWLKGPYGGRGDPLREKGGGRGQTARVGRDIGVTYNSTDSIMR